MLVIIFVSAPHNLLKEPIIISITWVTHNHIFCFKITFLSFYVLSDIDECSRNISKCDPNANCTDTDGGYLCYCSDGFSGTGFLCNGLK